MERVMQDGAEYSAWAEAGAEPAPRHVWAMGMVNCFFGINSVVFLLTIPQLLAERHVPVPVINNITALGLLSTLAALLLSPLLDVGFTRRTYVLGLVAVACGLTVACFAMLDRPDMLAPLVFGLACCAAMAQNALGGWLGASLPKSAEKQLALWFNIGNSTGFGVAALLHYRLIKALPGLWGGVAVALMTALPLLLLPILPAPAAASGRLLGSFGALLRDLGGLLRQPLVKRVVLLFILPCGSFALTNAFGAIGADFGAGPDLVGLANGVGVVGIGIVGAFAIQPALKRFAPALVYVAVGVVGACGTLGLVALPKVAAVYVLAVVAQNLFQSASFSTQNVIIFGAIPKDSPVAATQFALFITASNMALTYMESLDGQGYGWRGVAGEFGVDGLLTLVACLGVAWPVWRWHKRGLLAAG